MGVSDEKSKRVSRIANIQFFAEAPIGVSDPCYYMITELPKDFVESADRELGLDGELISWVEAQGVLMIERIKHIEDSERRSFFSSKAKSPLWDVYYCSGASSGLRYSILVDFHVHPGVRFDTKESQQRIYLEYNELFDKAAFEYILKNAGAKTETVADCAMGAASHRIMIKYGISEEEMLAIIVNGAKERSSTK
jgi:hypothetical protein